MALPVPKLWYAIYVWSVWRAFRHVVASGFRPDVIHANVYEAGFAGMVVAKLYGMPFVLTEVSTSILRGDLNWMERLLLRAALRGSDMVVPVSDALAKALRHHSRRTRIRAVPCTVNTQLFRCVQRARPSREMQKTILMLAIMRPRKGVPVLLHAVRAIRNRRTDFVLNIAGDGLWRSEYEILAKALGISEFTKFHGFVDESRKIELLQQCDFFVLPSSWENFGVVLIEAMACGKPVIATARGGPREFVTPAVGVLAPPDDSDGLAAAIEYMLDHYRDYDPCELQKHAQERFGYEAVGLQFDSIYRKLLGQGGGDDTVQRREFGKQD
jgi:L-malate glycosyltransferase